MLNTTNNNSKTVINSPATGIIQRSNPKSFFVTLHQTSQLRNQIFCDKPKYGNKEVMIIQVLLSHESYLLVELLETKDF